MNDANDTGARSPDGARLAVRFVDAQSGRNELLGRVAAVQALAAVVARRLEGERAGSRFPLLRLIGRPEPLSATECEALAREVTRLRGVLAPMPAALLADDTAHARDGESAALGAWLDATGDGSRPRSLADAFAEPLFVLEHIARLGAASRRGARFEIGDASEFEAARTPLNGREPL